MGDHVACRPPAASKFPLRDALCCTHARVGVPADVSGEPAGWEHFAHEADVGVRGFGPTREAAFEQSPWR
jgi:hypothetical protein